MSPSGNASRLSSKKRDLRSTDDNILFHSLELSFNIEREERAQRERECNGGSGRSSLGQTFT
jgi:hypothetical protein